MKWLMVFAACFFSVFSIVAEERVCWIEYKYDGETNGPGGSGGSSMTRNSHEAFVYKLCKEQCYGVLPNYRNISGIKSCTLDGIPIEESYYKEAYLAFKDKICHVQAEGKPFNLYLAENEAECKAHMESFVWCQRGAKCTYSLGKW